MTACHHTTQKEDRHPAETFGWLWAWLARLWVVAGSAVGAAGVPDLCATYLGAAAV